VVDIDPASATVRLGPKAWLERSAARLTDIAFAEGVVPPFSCDAVVRYRGKPTRAQVERGTNSASTARNGDCLLKLDAPVHAVVPGQVAVFYDGDRVLGGGTITETHPQASRSA
jgi:tRNA-specific 2-thiouridylase